MIPVSGNAGFYEKDLIFAIEYWVREAKLGYSFSSSTGFLMPNGAMRSPDACWISDERWATVTEAQKKKFPPVVPDFVAEIRSATDSLKGSKAKMEEWVENGIRLAWLVDIKNKQVLVYREDGSIEIVKDFEQKLSGEAVLPDFVFDLSLLRMP